MKKGTETKEILLTHACRMFWSKGYSNVSVREIAKASGVDVALIARYFGSKFGLFEATLETLQKINPASYPTPELLIDMLVEMYARGPNEGTDASPISMILINANDREVGELVIERQYACWQNALEEIIGSKSQAALFFAAVMGFSVAQKTLHMDGIATPGTDAHRAQLRYMLMTTLDSPDC